MRPLGILSVGYALAPVGPDAVGGSEQVLASLDRALVERGHRSIVVAWAGSRVRGRLVPIAPPPNGPIDQAVRAQMIGAMRGAIGAALDDGGIDLIHMHGLDFAETMPDSSIPMLASIHLPAAFYPASALRVTRPRTWLLPVSHTLALNCPPGPWLLPPIENGVDVDRLGHARHGRRGYAIQLARVCPEKGQHLALRAARDAGVGLLIGGEVHPYEAHRRYFVEEVAPLLDDRRRFLGPLCFARKRRLLAAARCLLIPSLVPETSSLVAMEAAACGTPVIAFRAGALPITVEDGRTGILVNDADQMANAIGRVSGIDSADCRAVARDRFSSERMADEYLALYHRLAA